MILQVRSFHDKMEMAKFFIYRSSDSELSKKVKEFLRKHEGRARKFAVRKNDNELLQLYHKNDFWWDIEKFEETKDA